MNVVYQRANLFTNSHINSSLVGSFAFLNFTLRADLSSNVGLALYERRCYCADYRDERRDCWDEWYNICTCHKDSQRPIRE